ncbi:murein transglycosylase [Vibrio parahaemolyticus]|nr:murein transglycosylase [Vibrio parahaemolyticus]
MDELTTSKRIGLVLKHFVVAFQLRRLHLFAILLLFFFTEKSRVKKNSFLLFL